MGCPSPFTTCTGTHQQLRNGVECGVEKRLVQLCNDRIGVRLPGHTLGGDGTHATTGNKNLVAISVAAGRDQRRVHTRTARRGGGGGHWHHENPSGAQPHGHTSNSSPSGPRAGWGGGGRGAGAGTVAAAPALEPPSGTALPTTLATLLWGKGAGECTHTHTPKKNGWGGWMAGWRTCDGAALHPIRFRSKDTTAVCVHPHGSMAEAPIARGEGSAAFTSATSTS
jgi:hypothetical protein